MNDDTASTLATLLVAALVLFILALLLATPAGTREVCLTKEEARKLWPRQHLYWYSADHCWSNRRGPPSNIKIDPIKEPTRVYLYPLDPNGAVDGPFEDYCCWPSLDDLKAHLRVVK